MNSSLTRTELLAFWKKIDEIGLGVGTRAVVAGLDQGEGLGLFLGLALDEVHDVRVVHIQNGHLGRAAGFAAGLDDAGKGVKAAHEAERAAGRAAARDRLLAGAAELKLVPVPEPYLNSSASVLASVIIAFHANRRRR